MAQIPTHERASALALKAMGWMAADEDRIGAFLAASGCSPDELRTRMAEPEFLGFVLDHLLGDDEAVVAFAADAGVAPEEVAMARRALPGGDTPEWT